MAPNGEHVTEFDAPDVDGTAAPSSRPSASRAAPPGTDGQLSALTYSEISVALHVAGLPSTWRRMTADDLTALALAGIAKVGLAEIRRIDTESRRIALDLLARIRRDPNADVSTDRGRLDQIWGAHQHHQSATDAAWVLAHGTTILAHGTTPAGGMAGVVKARLRGGEPNHPAVMRGAQQPPRVLMKLSQSVVMTHAAGPPRRDK